MDATDDRGGAGPIHPPVPRPVDRVSEAERQKAREELVRLEDGPPVSIYVGKERLQTSMPLKLLMHYASKSTSFKRQTWTALRLFLDYTPITRYMPNTDNKGHSVIELPQFDDMTFRHFRVWTAKKEIYISCQYTSLPPDSVPNLEDMQSDILQLCELVILAQQLGIDDEFVVNVVQEFKSLFAAARSKNLRTPVTQDALLLLESELEDYSTSEAWDLLNVELGIAFAARIKDQRAKYEDFQTMFELPSFRENQWNNVLTRYEREVQNLDKAVGMLNVLKNEKEEWGNTAGSENVRDEGRSSGFVFEDEALGLGLTSPSPSPGPYMRRGEKGKARID